MPRVVQSEYRKIEETLRTYPTSTSNWAVKTREGLKDPSRWVWSDTCMFLHIDDIDNIRHLTALRRAIRAIEQKKSVAGQEHKLYSLQNREKVLTSELERATLETSTNEGASIEPRISYESFRGLYQRGANRMVTPIFTEVSTLPDDFFQ